MVEVIYLFLLWGLVFGWVLIVVEERETMGEEKDNEEDREMAMGEEERKRIK